MRPWTRRIALLVVAAALAGVSFYFGGVMGFIEGRGFQLGQSSSTEAWQRYRALEALRSGEIEAAIESLESQIDGYLIQHGVDVLIGRSFFGPRPSRPPMGFKLLRQVAEYRLAIPPVIGDPEVRSTVTGIVDCLTSAPDDLDDSDAWTYLEPCYRESW